MQASLEKSIAQEIWPRASSVANDLSELILTIGDVGKALVYAEQSVELADKSGSEYGQLDYRISLGDIQHQMGHLVESQATFQKAEEIHKKLKPYPLLLHSLRGFRYCDLLLSQENYAEVEKRENQTLEYYEQWEYGVWTLGIALDNLSLGWAQLLHFQHDSKFPITNVITILNHALDGLRQAQQQEYIALGLLARATHYRVTGNLDKAQRDTDEAFTIASRGGMGLHLADCHLEYARLALARGEKDDAREYWQIAKDNIEKMDYHRRDKEVEELEKQLAP